MKAIVARANFGTVKRKLKKILGRFDARIVRTRDPLSFFLLPLFPDLTTSHSLKMLAYTALAALALGLTASAQSIPATASAEDLALVSAQFANSGFNLTTVRYTYTFWSYKRALVER
jgi:hypothetical protein